VDSEEILGQVAREVTNCTSCGLHHSRKHSVPGEGPADAEIMFIGEGPGFHENEQGRPFVGAAGKFLDELLVKNGLQRDQVFITNVVKCRPPGNRDPLPEEVDTCTRLYLERQIQTINPAMIVTLGRYSMGHYLPTAKISNVHGQSMLIKGKLIIPMYHPAAALHQQSLRPVIEQDFAELPKHLAKLSKRQELKVEESEEKEEPKQLSLF
jgi:uracil-DNA glycosylase